MKKWRKKWQSSRLCLPFPSAGCAPLCSHPGKTSVGNVGLHHGFDFCHDSACLVWLAANRRRPKWRLWRLFVPLAKRRTSDNRFRAEGTLFLFFHQMFLFFQR
ncbi:hypothetical protein TW95_gp0917 [Pandoravirus inopinatum]|uniref:Uncharacterized protein n=1 Tax=Pandoravirus inopinatum TaxID=1605721 RepID=A0A0B5J9W6_9VIRU|nr:hypothetical protein TW95_gp0917 [Pandoravirus inopinatum]AJF97651.1 hypothetical protein [Pandoravirus inopinatum]